jgi:transposase
MVFVVIEGKSGHRWYLWVFRSETTVFFKTAPTRGRCVIDEHFRDSWGIVSVDRYLSYKVLLSTGRFLLAFCWAHVRRDFLELEIGHVELAEWSRGWVERINLLYHINNKRITYEFGSQEFAVLQIELETAIGQFKLDSEIEAKEYQADTTPARLGVLESLQNHWNGLTLFVKFHWVPMDNNRGERVLRGPVVARKNYYACGSLASVQLTDEMHSILGTLDLWGINSNLWLKSYLDACAENKGRAPENIDEFLPWKMSDHRLEQLGSRSELRPVPYSKITKEEIQCATVDEFFVKKKSKSSDKSFVKCRNQNTDLQYQERSASG